VVSARVLALALATAAPLVGLALGNDPAGNAYVTWARDGQPRLVVHQADGSWTAPVSLPARSWSPPALAFDGGGRGLMVWRDTDGTVQTATSPRAGRWSAARALPTSTDQGGDQPALAVNRAGQALAVWLGSQGERAVHVAAGSTRGAWSAPLVVSGSLGAGAVEPRLTLDDGGRGTVMWIAKRAIFVAERRGVDASWSAPRRLSPVGDLGFGIDLATSNRGRAAAVWAPSGRIEARLRSESGRWGPVQRLSGGSASNPRAAVSDSGAVAIAWTTLAPSRFYTAEVAVGGRVLEPTRLPRADWNNCLPRIAFSGGIPVAAWVASGAGDISPCDPASDVVSGTRAKLVVSTASAGWTPPIPVFGGVRSVTRAELTIAPVGTAVVTWAEPAGVGASAVRLATRSRSTREWR